jgi:hypothetical protein
MFFLLARAAREGGHLKTMAQKERERPNRIVETVVPARHDKRTGL